MKAAVVSLPLLAVLLTTAVVQEERPTRAGALATSDAERLEQAVTLLESRGDARGALRLLEAIVRGPDRDLAARALVYVGACHERLGNHVRARAAYVRVDREFGEHRAAVSLARARLSALPPVLPTNPPALALRRFWSSQPPADLQIGTLSLDGRSLALFDASGVLRLQDMRSGVLGPVRRLGGGEPDPSCVIYGVALAPNREAAAFSRQCGEAAMELRLVALHDRPGAERVLHRTLPGAMIEPVEWRRRVGILARISHPDGSATLLRVPPDGTPSLTVATLPVAPSHASLSPDGHWVAYDAPDMGRPPRRDVLVAPASGGPAQVVAGGAADDLMPVWTADGSALTWISDRTATSGLWWQAMRHGVPVGSPRLVAPDLGRVAQPIGLNERGSFVYFRQTGLVDVQVVSLGDDGQRTSTPSSDGTRYVGATMSPTWSPDGTRLAYRVELGVSRAHAIGIRDFSTADERILPTDMGWIDMPRWAPDGTRLLVRGRSMRGGYGFYTIDVATGATAAVKIVPLMEEDTLGSAQWEPSSRGIVYTRGRQFRKLDLLSGRDDEWFVLPDAARPVVLPDPGFALADDGRVAFVQHVQGVTSLQVRGTDGSTRAVVEAAANERLAGVVWNGDQTGLLFTRWDTRAANAGDPRWPSVWSVRLDTGQQRPLGLARPRLRGLALSRDGRRLAFTTGAPTREPWVLEHFLPTRRPAVRR